MKELDYVSPDSGIIASFAHIFKYDSQKNVEGKSVSTKGKKRVSTERLDEASRTFHNEGVMANLP